MASAAESAACGVCLQCKQLTACLIGCEHRKLLVRLKSVFFFSRKKRRNGFSVLSGYSDLTSDVVDVRVQKDYS